jgi:hypothetical protein
MIMAVHLDPPMGDRTWWRVTIDRVTKGVSLEETYEPLEGDEAIAIFNETKQRMVES